MELAHQIIYLKGLSDYGGKGSTYSPGVISGGKAVNVVSDYAEATVDWRMCVPEDIPRTRRLLAERKAVLPGAQVKLELFKCFF